MIELSKMSRFTSLAKALICLSILALSAMTMKGQGSAIWGQAVTSAGKPAAYATVRVCAYTGGGIPCSPLSSAYSDLALTQPVPNPYTSDQYGNFSFFVAAGSAYIVQLNVGSNITYSYLVTASGTGTGTVTSVGLTMPNILVCTGSPITGSGVIACSLSTQIAHYAWMGPTSGSPAAPTFRAIAAPDLPFTYSGNTLELATVSGTITPGDCAKWITNSNLGDAGAPCGSGGGGGSPGGSNFSIQYNNSAAFGGVSFTGPVMNNGTASAPSAATSPQLVTALNASPSSTLAPALLPLATTSAFGAVKPDNSTITISGGVISAVGGSGCTPGGATNSLQKKNGSGGCSAANALDNGSLFAISEASQITDTRSAATIGSGGSLQVLDSGTNPYSLGPSQLVLNRTWTDPGINGVGTTTGGASVIQWFTGTDYSLEQNPVYAGAFVNIATGLTRTANNGAFEAAEFDPQIRGTGNFIPQRSDGNAALRSINVIPMELDDSAATGTVGSDVVGVWISNVPSAAPSGLNFTGRVYGLFADWGSFIVPATNYYSAYFNGQTEVSCDGMALSTSTPCLRVGGATTGSFIRTGNLFQVESTSNAAILAGVANTGKIFGNIGGQFGITGQATFDGNGVFTTSSTSTFNALATFNNSVIVKAPTTTAEAISVTPGDNLSSHINTAWTNAAASTIVAQINNDGSFQSSSLTSGGCVSASSGPGKLSVNGTACGFTPLNQLTAATGSSTIANANFNQIWNWHLTTNSVAAMTFGETTASTGTTDGILAVNTLAGSTAVPVTLSDSLTGSQTLSVLDIAPTWNTSGVVDAALRFDITNTASGAGSKIIDAQIVGTGSVFSLDKTGKVQAVTLTDGTCSISGGTLTGCSGGGGSGTVTSFAAPSGSWPTWLVPTVTNSTSTPSLAVAASAIPNSALASQTANTVLGALTATTPTGLAVPSCSGATNALTWTSGTGFGCNTITGGVSSVSNSDGTVTVTPTTGAVVASLNLAHANAWTAAGNTFNGVTGLATGTATSGANFSGTFAGSGASVWNGTAASGDFFGWVDVAGTGSNPTVTLTAQHTGGGSGVAAVSIPFATALGNGSTATTQSPGDSTTKIATTAFVAAASIPAYPQTVTGCVSGGVLYGSLSTQVTCSPAGTANVLMKWGGAATAPQNSLWTDNGTTSTYTGSGGTSALQSATTGTGSGQRSWGVSGTADTWISRTAAGTLSLDTSATPNGSGTWQVGQIQNSLMMSSTTSPTIASSSTIAPITSLVTISGTTTINTITLPTGFVSGCFDILASGAWSTGTSGNIQAVVTATANVQYRACYFTSLSKWVIK